jgi:alkaline phosphatase D
LRYSRRNLITASLSGLGAGLVPARLLRAAELQFDSNPFTLGIASGYPETDAVVLWTRLAPEPLAPGGGMPAGPMPVAWEVAADDSFARVVREGTTYATSDWAHSVHVEVTGLEPGRDYWYRFTSGGARSPVGHARTIAVQATRLRLAVACCQQYEGGRYAAYGAIARDDPDAVVHVGDYIYEQRGVARVRTHDLPECYTLEDYRARYALYKSDAQLQAAHASAAWILTWDDHEVDNDYADAHSEGDDPPELFLQRRAAAYQAYYEHQPLPRRMVPFGAHQRLHAHASFGDLVSIFMLDGRQYRSPQACGRGTVTPCAALYAQERTMLGQRQEQWLTEGLAARSARWNVIAQQTVVADMDQRPGPDIGYWNDGWSGYPAARRRLMDTLGQPHVRNPVVLSGDVHAFLANDLHAVPGDLDSPIVAPELVTTSISSPGPPQAALDAWRAENANVHLARSNVRGYTRLEWARNTLAAELVGVRDVARADSDTYVLARYELEEDGRRGIAG